MNFPLLSDAENNAILPPWDLLIYPFLAPGVLRTFRFSLHVLSFFLLLEEDGLPSCVPFPLHGVRSFRSKERATTFARHRRLFRKKRDVFS